MSGKSVSARGDPTDLQGLLKRASPSDVVEIVRRRDGTLPIFAKLDGVAVVIVDAREYRHLKAASLRLPVAQARLKVRAPRSHAPRPSTIERDPEVAGFLRVQFRQAATLDEVRSACLERFGPERTPSIGRVGRFRAKVRDGV